MARDVGSKLWGHRVHVGDAVPCCSLLNSLGGEEVGEEVDGIDPLGLTISSQEFFIDGDVTFGVDACCGFSWWSFDGAVDVFVMEAFVDEAPVACDTRGWVPAVDVSMMWVRRVRE